MNNILNKYKIILQPYDILELVEKDDCKSLKIESSALYINSCIDVSNGNENMIEVCTYLWNIGIGKGFLSRGNPYSEPNPCEIASQLSEVIFLEDEKENLFIDEFRLPIRNKNNNTNKKCDLYVLTLEEILFISVSYPQNNCFVNQKRNQKSELISLKAFLIEFWESSKTLNNQLEGTKFVTENDIKQQMLIKHIAFLVLRNSYRFYPRSGIQFGCDYVVYTTPTPESSHSKYISYINFSGNNSSLVRTGASWHKSVLLIRTTTLYNNAVKFFYNRTNTSESIFNINSFVRSIIENSLTTKIEKLFDFIVLFRVIPERRLLPRCSSLNMFLDEDSKESE